MKSIPLQVDRDDSITQVTQNGYKQNQRHAAKIGIPALP